MNNHAFLFFRPMQPFYQYKLVVSHIIIDNKFLDTIFYQVLSELMGDQSLEKFRLEYEKLHRALKKSHDQEKNLPKLQHYVIILVVFVIHLHIHVH